MTLLSATGGVVAGAMEEDVSKTIAFLAKFSEELVGMQKQTLEALLKSSRAKQVKEWNAAKNFWYRKSQRLEDEQRQTLEDWEFVLCDMSSLLPVALLPRLQRCLDRSETFLNQHAATIKQLHGKTLQNVLRSRHLKENCMAVFTSLLLKRYRHKFTEEQEDLVVEWEAELCEQSAEILARAAASRAKAFAGVQQFFALHYEQILQVSKPTLRDVVMSNQAHGNTAWMQARKFFLRHLPLVTPEQQELLNDWEFVLCDTSTLLPVALLPRLQRCMDRSQTFVNQTAELCPYV